MRTLELFLFFSFCLVLASCSASSPKPTNQEPESIVVPVSVLGEVSGVRSQILQNTLNETISTKFRIVPQEKFEDIFKPFFTLDPSRNKLKGESGLGMTIARDIVRAHGGDIALSKSSMGGLKVTIKLPK